MLLCPLPPNLGLCSKRHAFASPSVPASHAWTGELCQVDRDCHAMALALDDMDGSLLSLHSSDPLI